MEYFDFLSKFYSKEFVDELQESLNTKPISSLWLNPLKMPKVSFDYLEKNRFVPNSYYFDKEKDSLGKDILHDLGSYYIQDASAMMVPFLLDVKDGESVIDLCAAPGGKSCFVASHNKNSLIVSNDISFKRSLDLLENIERLGIKNCLIFNEDPTNLSNKYFGYFDKVILDAPCSGEGMFRKNKEMLEDWSENKVNNLVDIQKKLIIEGYNLLKEGGIMSYSTCTFNKYENEDIVNYLIENTNASLIDIKNLETIDRGINQKESIRFFPNHHKGEGQFMALIRCNDKHNSNVKYFKGNIDNKSYKIIQKFSKNFLNLDFDKERLFTTSNKIYYLPNNCIDFSKLNIIKSGLYLGEINKDIFTPSHHLASSLKKEDWKFNLNLTKDNINIQKYIRGETFPIENSFKGYGIICVEDIPLGLIKISNNTVKNFYPKKLRRG